MPTSPLPLDDLELEPWRFLMCLLLVWSKTVVAYITMMNAAIALYLNWISL
jgi:hypothetical protein